MPLLSEYQENSESTSSLEVRSIWSFKAMCFQLWTWDNSQNGYPRRSVKTTLAAQRLNFPTIACKTLKKGKNQFNHSQVFKKAIWNYVVKIRTVKLQGHDMTQVNDMIQRLTFLTILHSSLTVHRTRGYRGGASSSSLPEAVSEELDLDSQRQRFELQWIRRRSSWSSFAQRVEHMWQAYQFRKLCGTSLGRKLYKTK